MSYDKEILSRFIVDCQKAGLIGKDDYVLSAVSGGPDSMSLLDLLNRWKNKDGGFSLAVCHFNHQLRAEADSEQCLVEDFCCANSIRFIGGSSDVDKSEECRIMGVHAAARELRYRFLSETVEKIKSEIDKPVNVIIATGHHRDDQVETVLMRLFQGSGLDGLAGIRRIETWHEPFPVKIIRPLLNFSRSELEDYVQSRKIVTANDLSNLDITYPRNHIRHNLLPVIRKSFGEEALSGIIRSSEQAQMVSEVVQYQFEKALNNCLILRRDNEIVLDYSAFSSYLLMIRLKLLLYSAQSVVGKYQRISLERCRKADQYLRARKTGAIEIGGGIKAQLSDRRIYLYYALPQIRGELLGVDESRTIPGVGKLEVIAHSIKEVKLPPKTGSQFIDLDKTGSGLFIIRSAQPGDRINPVGMKGRRKVSDILRENGVPPHKREYPVVEINGKIAVIPPFRIDSEYRLTDDTTLVAEFRLTFKE